MKLLKFGGTSLANAEKFLCVADIIEKKNKKEQTAVVLSAPAKITNYLVTIIEKKIDNDEILKKINLAENIFIELIKDIKKIQSLFPYENSKEKIQTEFNKLKKIINGVFLIKQCPESIQPIIISRGEILSVIIMKNILKSRNHEVTILNPVENLLSTGSYLDSTVDIKESKKRIKKININQKNIILMPGFIAGNKKGELVVLGRNGSDYSAAVLASCLNAKCCEIWTDVDGVFTADPRIVSNAHLLESISYQEAMELSYFGAKVLHPRTIEPISQFQIPCIIKNTNNIHAKGTLICQKNNSNENFLKGVTHLDNIVMFNISGSCLKDSGKIISRIFSTLARENIEIILITQSSSENKINFCTLKKDVDYIFLTLKKEFKLEIKEGLLNSLNIVKNLAILSVIGSNISEKNNIASKIFSSLGSSKINVLAIAHGSSEHSISVVIKKENLLQGVQNIHNALFFKKKIINVFLIGIGGVGKALLKQILKQEKFLEKKNIKIKLRMIANSKKLLFLNDFITLNNWEENFKKSKEEFNLTILNKILKNTLDSNSVIIDCTSNELLSKQYVHFIKNGFHIVTSNKKANTNSLKYYNEIRTTALKENKKFLYETNVGAGLPVINTLQNLFNTGDYLTSFKGILSGSLSYIFGKLEEGISLSEATKEAQKLGFTEPNPFDDLSGIDVARKLLVLAREIGYAIELKDISIEPILPEKFKNNQNSEEFLIKLQELDLSFTKRVNKARNLGNVLRFVGSIEKNGICSVKIEEINNNNPLYKVKNGENALTFYTNYYKPIPLVLRGYGAGNNVTASGVFSDLLRIIL
ncbi:bifunctional aspartate kinase/homoserine dehydrogenase I [Buchnera aphidicola]|uniref:Bifunctional aspartokinase/homoserine dehydrogenase n=1 Tax=Buchnera aphidicola subsp. Rhopalosiphum maidis TaxID=118109 RepID=A0A3G2I6P8_BUCRM|nr:bifunctional aspartate kinase/homoserine dehydrogenase I [Buchnera aphidicola]AYN24851.1 bifunctional aspartate kinase/homoserine dehydrogenase I [Buchnera aphidicola (Rhopalosiphum maidis)]